MRVGAIEASRTRSLSTTHLSRKPLHPLMADAVLSDTAPDGAASFPYRFHDMGASQEPHLRRLRPWDFSRFGSRSPRAAFDFCGPAFSRATLPSCALHASGGGPASGARSRCKVEGRRLAFNRPRQRRRPVTTPLSVGEAGASIGEVEGVGISFDVARRACVHTPSGEGEFA